MLRNVLDDYLSVLRERELDLPILALLPAMGFHDVHFVHGSVEFGKDFIAKRDDEEGTIQYSFQSKVGDIGQRVWRNEIYGQVLESVLSSISHPNFDTTMPHQAVLMTTGDLKGNAALGFQDLNRQIESTYKGRPVIFWSKENLIDFFTECGLNGLLHATASGFIQYGRFLAMYGQASEGVLTDRVIEEYSKRWVRSAKESPQWLLQATLESETLAKQCFSAGRYFAAIQAKLAMLRVLTVASYYDCNDQTKGVWSLAREGVFRLSSDYVSEMEDAWKCHRDLARTIPVTMTSYLIHCARTIEIASLAYFTADSKSVQDSLATFLVDFVTHEPGCVHPLSDRYVVSLVLAILVLRSSGHSDVAADMLKRATIWLCDRYEQGMGLASVDDDTATETNILLGYPFEFIQVPCPAGSFLACALVDLAASMGNAAIFRDVVNDIKACGIYSEYWQPQDTDGACMVDGEDVVFIPSVEFLDELPACGDYAYGSHLRDEPLSFKFIDDFGIGAAPILMALLRDRYFPKLWPQLIDPSGV